MWPRRSPGPAKKSVHRFAGQGSRETNMTLRLVNEETGNQVKIRYEVTGSDVSAELLIDAIKQARRELEEKDRASVFTEFGLDGY